MRSANTRVAAILSLSVGAWPYGACDEDRMAATFDQCVWDKALNAHHLVAFCSVDEHEVAAEQQIKQKKISKMDGVDPDSVLLARDSTTLSFSFDLAKGSAEALLTRIKTEPLPESMVRLIRVRSKKLRVAPIRKLQRARLALGTVSI